MQFNPVFLQSEFLLIKKLDYLSVKWYNYLSHKRKRDDIMLDIIKDLLSTQLVLSLIVLIAIILIIIIIGKFKNKYRDKHPNENGMKKTILSIFIATLRFFVLLFGIIVILQINGIDVSGMIAGVGIASAIIGLALQDLLKDIIMGINIIADHFFSMGECVEFEGREGVIVGMSLKSTKIGDLDDHSVTTVCNRNISQIRRLGNRLDIDVPLSYGEDISLVQKTLSEICKEIENLENVTKCTFEGTQSFESSSINYRIRVFCEAKFRADVRRASNGTIQKGLEKAGIHIPFNQLDVHLDSLEK